MRGEGARERGRRRTHRHRHRHRHGRPPPPRPLRLLPTPIPSLPLPCAVWPLRRRWPPLVAGPRPHVRPRPALVAPRPDGPTTPPRRARSARGFQMPSPRRTATTPCEPLKETKLPSQAAQVMKTARENAALQTRDATRRQAHQDPIAVPLSTLPPPLRPRSLGAPRL